MRLEGPMFGVEVTVDHLNKRWFCYRNFYSYTYTLFVFVLNSLINSSRPCTGSHSCRKASVYSRRRKTCHTLVVAKRLTLVVARRVSVLPHVDTTSKTAKLKTKIP